ncbi:MAG TPA: tetratricopeptide repeat protein [Luteimonas sp.]|nr:tetratricopeptide repeat protein [Luteimonas sp.]
MRDWFGPIKHAYAEFKRRRVFRVAAAYLIAGWLLIQVGDATFEPLGFPAWSMRLLIAALAAGFVLACVLAWIYDITSRGVERTPPVVPATNAAPEASVAILPFADLSEARDQAYFCDGLAEEIINALAGVRGLRVASRTSSFRFREGGADARDIGRALNVAAFMEGSVRKSGERIRVTAQLIDAGSGYHLWSENFDRRLEDVFSIQEGIARSVVQALHVSLKTPAVLDLESKAPRDLRAYDFYLRGRQMLAMKSASLWESAPEMFRRAIALDPDYAQAHAGLADALVNLMRWRRANRGDVWGEAHDASRRALALAPDSAEAQAAYANTLSIAGEDTAAVAAYERAIALNPGFYEAHLDFARHCFGQGRYARAIDELEAAHRVRPEEFQALALAVGAADAMGDAPRAADLARRALTPALAEAAADPENGRALYMLAGLQWRLDDREGGRRSIEAALRLSPDEFSTLYNAACFYALAGENDRAMDLLERAMLTGRGSLEWIEHDHDLDSLRSSPRFEAMMAAVRMDPV